MSQAAQRAAQEERERQRQYNREQTTLQYAFNQQGELKKGLMRELLNTDDLEKQLQPQTIHKIRSLLNKQWVLANLTDAETHDKIYWLEVQRYKILGAHPPSESSIKGPVRAFLWNDEWEDLNPLTAQERNAIDQVIKGLQNMATRSRGGFERKQQQTQIARSETGGDTDDGKKEKFSFFS